MAHKYSEQEVKRIENSRALHYGYKDNGHFGCDMDVLCKNNYTYVANGHGCNDAFMFILDTGVDENYTRVEDTDKTAVGVCHFIASKNLFKKPMHCHIGKSAKVDLTTPGLNAYYIPQKMKYEYTSPKKYFTASKEERRSLRTRPQKFKNDWKRAELRGKLKYAEKVQKEEGKPVDHGYFNKAFDATHIGDVENPYTGRAGYKKRDILAYTNIVIDIDNHDMPCEWVQKLADDTAKLLLKGCDEDGVILDLPVLPQMIVKTGRGLQLYFHIEPVYFPAASMVAQAAGVLCDFYDKFMKENQPDLEVDRAASLNIAGFKRMPGSFNSKATDKDGRWGYPVKAFKSKAVSQEPVKIETLFEKLGIPVYSKEEREEYNKEKEERERRNSVKKTEKDDRCRSTYKPQRSYKLAEFFPDYAPNVFHGKRNDFLFMAGTIAYEIYDTTEEVRTYMQGISSLYAEPLPDSEVEKTVRSVLKGCYHYRTSRIIGDLKLKLDDLAPYGITSLDSYSHKARDNERREKKAALAEKIAGLLSDGLSITAAAQEAEVCRKTVRNVRDMLIRNKKEHNEKIKERNLNSKESFDSLFFNDDKKEEVQQTDTKGFAETPVVITS